MSTEHRNDGSIDAALARLPQWEPPPGFAMRVAAVAAQETEIGRPEWTPLLLRGAAIAACVSVTAWLGAETLAGWLSATGPENQAALGWTVGAGSLLLGWHLIRRHGLSRA
jgi:hypothetical protein